MRQPFFDSAGAGACLTVGEVWKPPLTGAPAVSKIRAARKTLCRSDPGENNRPTFRG